MEISEVSKNGIYYLKGDFFPIQFLYLPKLDKEENYWLQSLRNNLKAGEEIRTLMSNYEKNRQSKDYSAVMNFITRANWEQMEVEKKMCDALNELFAEELEEADLRGQYQAAIEAYQEMGLSYEDTSARVKEKYQLTEDEIQEVMKKNWK